MKSDRTYEVYSLKRDALKRAQSRGHAMAKNGVLTSGRVWAGMDGEYTSECALCGATVQICDEPRVIEGSALETDCKGGRL